MASAATLDAFLGALFLLTNWILQMSNEQTGHRAVSRPTRDCSFNQFEKTVCSVRPARYLTRPKLGDVIYLPRA